MTNINQNKKKQVTTKRYMNPYFWIGLLGVIFVAMDVDVQTLTSWALLADAFKDLMMNPVKLGAVALAVLGVFVNPTTPGITDNKK